MILLSQIENQEMLKTVDDLRFFKDCFRGKEKFFMASEMRSQYLKVSKSVFEFFSTLLPQIEGKGRSEANDICLQLSKGKANLNKVEAILANYNLLEMPTKEVKSKVVFDLNSNKLLEIPLDNLQSRNMLLINRAYIFLKYITYLILVFTGINLILNYLNFAEIFVINNEFSWENIRISTFFIIIAISVIGLLIHEMGHLLMASHCGVRWKSFTLALIWGVSPVFYIRYKALCVYPTVSKIKILFAGIYMNIIQASVYYILFIYTHNWIMAIGIFINLMLALNCFLPSGANDGYSIMTLFLGIEGMFWKALKLLQHLIKDPSKWRQTLRNKEGVISIVYIITSYVLGVIGCVYLFDSVISYLHIFNIDKSIVTFCVMIFFIINTTFYVYKLLKNISSK